MGLASEASPHVAGLLSPPSLIFTSPSSLGNVLLLASLGLTLHCGVQIVSLYALGSQCLDLHVNVTCHHTNVGMSVISAPSPAASGTWAAWE